METRQAYLLLSNRVSPSLLRQYDTIRAAVSSGSDCQILYHQSDPEVPADLTNVPHFTFTDEVISRLNYFPIGFRLIPGNNHFPLLDFFLKHPDYDYYWVIEDDVQFSGRWRTFFDTFAGVGKDFISCHLRTTAEEPYWHWWSSLANPYQVIPFEKRIRSFNPIYRLSRKALAFIHDCLRSGWCGHHEVLFASLLSNAGFTIADFGGAGQFVLPGFENRFYVSGPVSDYGDLNEGTMKWRPVFSSVGALRDKLYHPVKD